MTEKLQHKAGHGPVAFHMHRRSSSTGPDCSSAVQSLCPSHSPHRAARRRCTAAELLRAGRSLWQCWVRLLTPGQLWGLQDVPRNGSPTLLQLFFASPSEFTAVPYRRGLLPARRSGGGTACSVCRGFPGERCRNFNREQNNVRAERLPEGMRSTAIQGSSEHGALGVGGARMGEGTPYSWGGGRGGGKGGGGGGGGGGQSVSTGGHCRGPRPGRSFVGGEGAVKGDGGGDAALQCGRWSAGMKEGQGWGKGPQEWGNSHRYGDGGSAVMWDTGGRGGGGRWVWDCGVCRWEPKVLFTPGDPKRGQADGHPRTPNTPRWGRAAAPRTAPSKGPKSCSRAAEAPRPVTSRRSGPHPPPRPALQRVPELQRSTPYFGWPSDAADPAQDRGSHLGSAVRTTALQGAAEPIAVKARRDPEVSFPSVTATTGAAPARRG
eukprot:XP_025008649.1 insulin receptor substrate 4-like [Gallus gallus]